MRWKCDIGNIVKIISIKKIIFMWNRNIPHIRSKGIDNNGDNTNKTTTNKILHNFKIWNINIINKIIVILVTKISVLVIKIRTGAKLNLQNKTGKPIYNK